MMKKFAFLLIIIFLSTNLVYSKGSGETSPIESAEKLLEEKKYNDAIALLTTYLSENPKAIYEVQSLIDDIRDERDHNNKIMDEIIHAIYDEEDFEKGATLIDKYEGNNPFPDNFSKNFVKDARQAAGFVINKKLFRSYMDQALVHLENEEFSLALDNYLLCLDFHNDEFDLLMGEDEVESTESIDLTTINENVPLNLYYSALKSGAFKEIDSIENHTEILREYILKLKDAYHITLDIINSDIIDMSSLANSLEIFKILPTYLEDFNSNLKQLDSYNKLFSNIDLDGRKSRYITYASLALTGREDLSEGFLYLINQIYPIYIDDLITHIESRAESELELGISLYQKGNNGEAQLKFSDTITTLNALETTASLWKSFIGIDKNFNLTGVDILKNKYRYIGDSLIGREVANAYKVLANYADSIKNSTIKSNLESYREFIVSQSDKIELEKEGWLEKEVDVNSRTIMLYSKAPKWINGLKVEYNKVYNDLIESEIALVDKISSKKYIGIFGFDVDKVDDDSDAMGELIRKAAIDITLEENIHVYFDINSTDERNLTTYNPEKSLKELHNIEGEYTVFIENLNNYITEFGAEKDYIFEDNSFSDRFSSVSKALDLANDNKTELVRYKSAAIEKITLSKESENRGNTLYQNAVRAFEKENFNEAREFLTTGKEVSEVALSYSHNHYIIDELIPSFYNLWDKISKEEATIVIKKVRKLITLGKTQYLEGAYIPASNLFKEAELKWASTNSEAHPEIPYWLALIRDALDIESGRYLSVTEPLYSILAGYLSFAEDYYRTGLKDDNKVNKLKDFAMADSYIIKFLEVRPLNERARFLQLQVLKSKDPEAFKVIFNNDFIRYRNNVLSAIDDNSKLSSNRVLSTLAVYENIVRDAYLLNPRLSNSRQRTLLERFYKPSSGSQRAANDEHKKTINESYIRFKDLYKIAEKDQGRIVKRLMDISEVALGFKRLPVDTSNIRKSNSIFLQAKRTLESTSQTEGDALQSIISELQRALTLNPGNDDIPVVIDDILVMLGEESHFQLAPAQDKVFREAQKDFIDGRYYDAKDKIINILKANSKNKNYPKLKELINRVEIKIKEEITI